ncbi:MAG: hypothetical protein LAN83_07300 [Acidobacteriia bacterium]|nr:hypothetical protein [Terriglobia bacterium]
MALFRKQPQPAPEPTREERQERALLAVESAVAELAGIAKKYRALQSNYSLVVNTWGNITQCALPDGEARAGIEVEARTLVNAHTMALGKFNSALNVWAGLQGGENVASNR